MSHWFHRNALKNTTVQSFALSLVAAQPQAIQLCDRLKTYRQQVLELMTDPSSDADVVDKQLRLYLSLLLGFVFNNSFDPNHGPTDSSKLRHYIKFKWTDTLLGATPCVRQDTVFELISICYKYSLWLTKHCAQLAAKSDITMETAKECHSCLRKAAGILTAIQNEWCDRLLEKSFSAGSDLDPRVLSAYIQQCQAEAQEVTIARAIELKHSPTLISALANETSKLFLAAASAIKALDQTKVSKWMAYFQLKSSFYESYAFCYLGESLLEQEKCGEAIRALEESEKFYEIAVKLCKEYRKQKSLGGTGAKIDEHLFFRKLQPQVKRTKDKCVRENGFIFHQKVPKECPVLELKATHGLVTPEEFSMPSLHELWTPQSYAAFDLSKNVTYIDPRQKLEKATKDKPEEPIPAMDEKPIKYSETDPKNQSGCQIQ
ncbi:BRO1 domain-containing protein BROX-like [Oppia nitens]|uniref:BRO1 domain-containing protein BROX-like n=1 Tax=Oppia nitens TaxID=1686743 RepID=UPI0023DCC61C|nr:BRO1 domain-containing protein BROX-like [Oppia nitens]